MRSAAYIGILAFVLFFGLGYSYFYPAHSPITAQSWFANLVVPVLDRWLVGGRRGAYSGHLVSNDGDLKFKSDSDFVFYPARPAQRFYGKTMISSGINSSANIEVAEGVRVQIESNSVVIIEPQVDGINDGPTIRVIGGAVVAKATTSTAKKVRVVAANGNSRVIDQKGVAVVSDGKGYMGELPENIQAFRESFATQAEQVGEREQLVREEAMLAEAMRMQADADKLAAATKAADLKAVEIKAAELAKAAKMKDFVIKSNEAPIRVAPPNAEQTQTVQVPREIARRKFNETQVSDVKVEPSTSVAKGVYFAKRGQKSAATRSFASALSSPLYSADKSFGSSVQLALDGMLESYELNRRCPQARDTLANAMRQYSDNAAAQRWGAQWSARLDSGKCKNVRKL